MASAPGTPPAPAPGATEGTSDTGRTAPRGRPPGRRPDPTPRHRPGPRAALPRPARRALLVAHVTASAAWLGLSLCLLALAVTGATTASPATDHVAYRAMDVFGDLLVAPLALLTFATGLVLSLGTHWGLARHRWVWTKFWLTLAAGTASLLALRPELDRAAAAVTAGEPVDGFSLLFPPSVSLSLYVFMTAISVLKPWGPTRRGRRTRTPRRTGASARPAGPADALEPPRRSGKPRPAVEKAWPPGNPSGTLTSVTTSSPAASAQLLRLPVRRLTLDDLTACGDLAASRGWGHETHKWRLLLSAGHGYGIDAPDRPGALIGAFVLTLYDALPEGRPYTCVSMVLVAERFARRGLGRRLMRHALAESGDRAAFLSATPHGRPLYEELGFHPVGTTCMLLGRFTPGDAPTPPAAHPHTVRTARATDLPAVRALDARAFGADRTELLARLPAFADRFLVAHDRHGALTGFAASWPNGDTTVLGPVVAHDLATAQALITDLARHADGPVRLDLDDRHPALGTWLRAHGLAGDCTCTCTLMVHTAPDLPGDPTLRFAPYSVALG